MELIYVEDLAALDAFLGFQQQLYSGNACYRVNYGDMPALLAAAHTPFRKHADVRLYMMQEHGKIVGRFALINDRKNPDMVMLAFFEAEPGLGQVGVLIKAEARRQFPHARNLVAGVDGHLNYGAGYLLNRFDEVPSYGLAYTLPYYPAYFEGFREVKLSTFMFPFVLPAGRFDALINRCGDLQVRPADTIMFREEVFLYTALNNACFGGHIYWTERVAEDDFEMLYPFRHLITGDNLLFAMDGTKPVGFLLWFPDFNVLTGSGRPLHAATPDSSDVMRLKRLKLVKRVRLAEIAVLPEYRNRCVELLLLKTMFESAMSQGFTECEGGFISETNSGSLRMALRYLERITGQRMQPYRAYGVYEDDL